MNVSCLTSGKAITRFLAAIALAATCLFGCSSGEDPTASFGPIEWPTSIPAQAVPTPGSSFGLIETSSPTRLDVLVGNTDKSQYAAYLDACKAKGFTEKSSDSRESYWAENAKGTQLHLEFHRDGNYMQITVDVPTEAAATEAAADSAEPSAAISPEASESSEDNGTTNSENAEAPARPDHSFADLDPFTAELLGIQEEYPSSVDPSAVTPDFKKTLDDYEIFLDDLNLSVYNVEEGTTSLEDLDRIYEQYTSILTTLDSIDPSTLTEADRAYFEEVSPRLYDKLSMLFVMLWD